MNSAPPTGKLPGGSPPPPPLPGQPFDPNAAPPRQKWSAGALIGGILAICVIGVMFAGVMGKRRQPPAIGPFPSGTAAPIVVPITQSTPIPTQPGVIPAATPAPVPTVKVHVSGAVRSPGVYDLPSDSRVQDAVQRAGGPLPEGDVNALNLAAFVKDGGKIVVPVKGSAPAPASVSTTDTPNQNPITALVSVNLNTATQAELEALPAIGPKMATQIITYRTQNGAFQSVDDLNNVPGIGAKKLEQVRPYVRIN